MGKLIVIEGLDGSGKATQADLLKKKLESVGKKVLKLSFPDYESDSSALVKMYLSGQFGSHPDDVNAYAASAFYAVDRYASYKTKWSDKYNDNFVIIADRYTTSNGVHQCSKLPGSQWDDFLMWLEDFEYEKLAIPKPDLVLYLDMSPAVSEKLILSRYKGDESKKDIHEKDKNYLKRSRIAAAFCAERLGWHTILCDNGTDPYPVEDISEKLLKVVLEIL
jgi:dTMP kinase